MLLCDLFKLIFIINGSIMCLQWTFVKSCLSLSLINCVKLEILKLCLLTQTQSVRINDTYCQLYAQVPFEHLYSCSWLEAIILTCKKAASSENICLTFKMKMKVKLMISCYSMSLKDPLYVLNVSLGPGNIKIYHYQDMRLYIVLDMDIVISLYGIKCVFSSL